MTIQHYGPIIYRGIANLVGTGMKSCPTPDSALLNRYRSQPPAGEAGAYIDCYALDIDKAVALDEFVVAFYTTPVFKLERLILKLLVAKPSSDNEAQQLADGTRDAFAAWTVEARDEDQLLMCDFRKRTRSWFMVKPIATNGQSKTTLYFGSAVVPVRNSRSRVLAPGSGVHLLLGFHKLYSKVLLYSAKWRLS